MVLVSQTITRQAFAKVNLSLELIGKRPDGYHQLRSVVQCISLADTIRMQPAPQGITLRTSGYPVPAGSGNLCYQAAQIFVARVGEPSGVEIKLVKRIPVGRGLGGGSSDAAAVLLGLSELVAQRPSAQLLRELAAEIGSDVPLFLIGGTVLMKGRGEVVRPLSELRPQPVFVIAWPKQPVSTTEAYGLLVAVDFTDGMRTDALVKRIEAGEIVGGEDLYNCFERVVLQHWPAVADVRERLAAAVDSPAVLSGSGSAVYALAADEKTAQAGADSLSADYEAVVAKPVDTGNMII